MSDCTICARITAHHAGTNLHVIHEFEQSLWVVGDHQFHPGYTLLLLKAHVREMHDLEPEIQQAYFAEVMRAGKTISEHFTPWKMNYSCLGNLDPHLHWHLFPRYADDPDRTNTPWFHADRFAEHTIAPSNAQTLATAIAATYSQRFG